MTVKKWGDYEVFLDRVLGRGGMGAVYMGRQVSVDRPIAVKVLKKELTQNPDFVKRFHREAAILARLTDSHIVQVFGAGEGEDGHFYAMEYVEGEDLAQRLKRGHKFTSDEVLRIAHRVGKALQAAWRNRIVHRDIKPSNIVITKSDFIKVMDFGLAKNPDMEVTQSEFIMGTAKYMSPEQATGSPTDVRSDIYALGIVLYELATGRAPFIGESPTAVIYQQVHKAPLRPKMINPAIPDALEALILRMIEKDPDRRFASPDDLLLEVKNIVEGVSPEEKETLFAQTLKAETPAPGVKKPSTVRKPATVRKVVPPPGPAPAPAQSSVGLYLSLTAVLGLLGTGGYYFIEMLKEAPAVSLPPPPMASLTPDPPKEAEVKPVPVPVPVSAAPAWEEQLRLGGEAFAARRWNDAYTHLEKARELGAKDDGRINKAKAYELAERGDLESDPESQLDHYKKAAAFAPEEMRLKVEAAYYRMFKKRAERHEAARDWKAAAEDWKRAHDQARVEEREQIKANWDFCVLFDEAVRAYATRDYKTAVEKYEKLARGDPRGYPGLIEEGRTAAEQGLKKAMAEAAERMRGEFEELVKKARAAHRRFAWKEARVHLEALRDARFEGQAREELERLAREVGVALAAPPGMAYVSRGRFKTTGGYDADPRPYYIDDHEATVGEYAAFLKAIEATGHHAGCHKDEPVAKRHEPQDWDPLKAERPVVNVDWWDAFSFAAWAGKRIPSEVEWEKAAGFDGEVVRIYPWGDEFRPEGGKSFYGCGGMGSGVFEWTSDGDGKKVVRGGVLLEEEAPENAKVATRLSYSPGYRSPKIGVRLVRDVSDR